MSVVAALDGFVTRSKLAEFFGRDPHPSSAGQQVFHIKYGRADGGYRFEWHPRTRKVYLVRLSTVPEIGEVMAFNVETHGDAINAVMIWCRGFNEGRRPDVTKPHLQE